MKSLTFTLPLLFTFLSVCDLFAQWESLGDGIIPTNHRTWSLKVAPDGSIWTIATFDNFPPTGQVPKVYRSTDEGNTWNSSFINQAESGLGWDISPVDSMTAYIALSSRGLYKTTNGAQNWTKVNSIASSVSVVHFFNENDGFLYGFAQGVPIVSVTATAGQTWKLIGGTTWGQPKGTSLPDYLENEYLGLGFSMNSSYDYHDNTCAIGMANGMIWISHDKGYNWERKDTPLSKIGLVASNIALKNENVIMVAGDTKASNNQLVPTVNYTSYDGGETWTQGGPSGMTCAATHFIPNTEGTFIMVGHNNFGTGATGTAITYDFGETWQFIDNTSLIAIDFLDEKTGYGSCCNNSWATANGQVHKWDFDVPTPTVAISRNDEVQLMPNPVSDMLFINTNGEFPRGKLSIEIYSLSGKRISNFEVDAAVQINIPTASLPNGFYSLKITGESKSVVKKFVKESF